MVIGRGKYGSQPGVGEVGAAATSPGDGDGLGAAEGAVGEGVSDTAATALADGEGLSVAGTCRPHELHISAKTSAHTTSLMDM